MDGAFLMDLVTLVLFHATILVRRLERTYGQQYVTLVLFHALLVKSPCYYTSQATCEYFDPF